jgi:uncharacterized spore protein YtfJ
MSEEEKGIEESMDDMEDWEIPDEIYSEDEAIEIVGDTMDSFLAIADVSCVYGAPLEKNGAVLIPAAEVLAVAGFGVGYGHGSGSSKPEVACCGECAEEELVDEDKDEDEEEEESGAPSGGGGGGGGKIFARPVAVVVVSPEGQVSVQPVVDPTKIVLAALAAGGIMVVTLLNLFKPRR